MKEATIQLARYNAWANRRMCTALKGFDNTRLDTEVPSSFPTIRRTVAHLRAAEQMWLERLQLAERPLWLGDRLEDSFAALCTAWLAASDGLRRFAEKQYSDAALLHVVEYRDLRNTGHKTPTFAILQHVFNHSTYHRGQLVTMMRGLGETKIPGTDYIQFVRSGGK